MRRLIYAALMVAFVGGCSFVPENIRAVFGEDCAGDLQDAIDTCKADAKDSVADELEQILQ